MQIKLLSLDLKTWFEQAISVGQADKKRVTFQ